MRTFNSLLIVAAVIFCASSVFAAHISIADNFTSVAWGSSDYSFVGTSHWTNDSGVSPNKRLRLTSSGSNQMGSVWLNSEQINASRDWAVTYRWQFTYAGGSGADGMGFHIQTQGTDINVGSEHASYTSGCLSISVDSYQNDGEASASALEVFFNGSQVGWFEIGGLGNGNLVDDMYRNDITYNAALQQLSVTVTDETTTNSVTQNYSVNLGSVFNNETDAYVGFSGNTGGDWENHDILYFGMNAVPEPTTLLLISGGAVLLAMKRKKRRG